MVNKKINVQQKKGSRLSQNNIKVQQLKNRQFILTLPSVWAQVLDVNKGSVITFRPGANGGVEIIKIDSSKEKIRKSENIENDEK